jgi:hypothetical protein
MSPHPTVAPQVYNALRIILAEAGSVETRPPACPRPRAVKRVIDARKNAKTCVNLTPRPFQFGHFYANVACIEPGEHTNDSLQRRGRKSRPVDHAV